MWTSCGSFFFQAEDGIRDYKVTGVQTCALPISLPWRLSVQAARLSAAPALWRWERPVLRQGTPDAWRRPAGFYKGDRYSRRSEGRRVGQGGRAKGRAKEEDVTE